MSETGAPEPLRVEPATEVSVLTYAPITERDGLLPRWIVWMAATWAVLAVINGIADLEAQTGRMRVDFGVLFSLNWWSNLATVFAIAGKFACLFVLALAIYMLRSRQLFWVQYVLAPIATVVALAPLCAAAIETVNVFRYQRWFLWGPELQIILLLLSVLQAIAYAALPAVLVALVASRPEHARENGLRVARVVLIGWGLASLAFVGLVWQQRLLDRLFTPNPVISGVLIATGVQALLFAVIPRRLPVVIGWHFPFLGVIMAIAWMCSDGEIRVSEPISMFSLMLSTACLPVVCILLMRKPNEPLSSAPRSTPGAASS